MNINEAVLKYETSRQLINQLVIDRGMLMSQCLYYCSESGHSCINMAYNDAREVFIDNGHFGHIDIEESFFNFINEEVGACDSCIKAWEIRKGPLAEAKKSFGIAKRSLSHHGKLLIKNQITD